MTYARHRETVRHAIVVGLIAAAVFLSGCARLPKDYPRVESTAFQDTQNTRLGQVVTKLAAEHPDLSGVYALRHGTDALVARLTLADMAERSIDVQYYIWHKDQTGPLLGERLLQAADRGVRVRVLIDDIGTPDADEALLVLNSHPNIEARLFNPIASRSMRRLGMLTEFRRINRRMHNKSFTVDNQVTIVGGRNIGDEYFDANRDFAFADLDLMAIGPVARETSSSFDLYWNAAISIPIDALNRKKVAPEALDERRREYALHRESMQGTPYIEALRQSQLQQAFDNRQVEFHWGKASLVFDHPDKLKHSPDDPSAHLTPQLRPLTNGATNEVVIVSPYFVPGKAGIAFFKALRKRGVRVVIVTNSLGSTDVAIVHAGYKRYRKPLLRDGVELYESRPNAQRTSNESKGPFRGSSQASLHAKSFVFDRRTIFVGSLNLDPRSIQLNTEVGIVFENPQLAAELTERLEKNLPQVAYHVELDESGSGLRWSTHDGVTPVQHTAEPECGFWRKFSVQCLSLLPIENQL